MASTKRSKSNEPTIANRRARREYFIDSTLECGVQLVGTEVKSVRDGRVSLAEGYVRASDRPTELTLLGVHIAEYPPAGERQHEATRPRRLLAHTRQIHKLADATRQKGTTLVPMKMYFVRGRIKLQIGLARGRRKTDKRRTLDEQQAKRDISREMSRERGRGR